MNLNEALNDYVEKMSKDLDGSLNESIVNKEDIENYIANVLDYLKDELVSRLTKRAETDSIESLEDLVNMLREELRNVISDIPKSLVYAFELHDESKKDKGLNEADINYGPWSNIDDILDEANKNSTNVMFFTRLGMGTYNIIKDWADDNGIDLVEFNGRANFDDSTILLIDEADRLSSYDVKELLNGKYRFAIAITHDEMPNVFKSRFNVYTVVDPGVCKLQKNS